MNLVVSKIWQSMLWLLIVNFFLCYNALAVGISEEYAQKVVKDAGYSLQRDYPKRSNIIRLGSPKILSQTDTEYILDKDIICDGTCFEIKQSKITLNLNGHNITYLDNSGKDVYGIVINEWNKNDIAIVNGRISQGRGACVGNANGFGCNPIFSNHESKNIFIAGLEITYSAPNTSGICLYRDSVGVVRHNTLIDKGVIVDNRHAGVSAIEGLHSEKIKIFNNKIVNARQLGIRVNLDGEVFNNLIFIDSRATNSTAISAASGSIHDNVIRGVGEHPIGIWPGNDIKIYNNYVEVQNTRLSSEYGSSGSAGLRMTWGNNNVEVFNNTFIVNADSNYNNSGVESWGRALFVGLPKKEQKAIFRDNLIIANSKDGMAKAAGIAVVCLNESPNLVFRNNTIISNWSNVLLADHYGHSAGFPKFVDNHFVKSGNASVYKTIRSQYDAWPSTGVFIGNSLEGGASFDSVDLEFSGSGIKEIQIGSHVHFIIKSGNGDYIKDASVTILDKREKIIFSGLTDRSGSIYSDVITAVITNQINGENTHTKNSYVMGPFKIIVEKNGIKNESLVNVKDNLDMVITLQ